jgi:hypothetical protein
MHASEPSRATTTSSSVRGEAKHASGELIASSVKPIGTNARPPHWSQSTRDRVTPATSPERTSVVAA